MVGLRRAVGCVEGEVGPTLCAACDSQRSARRRAPAAASLEVGAKAPAFRAPAYLAGKPEWRVLIDVDAPSVHTVPSDFIEQEIVDIAFDQITSGSVFAAKKCDVGAAAITIREVGAGTAQYVSTHLDRPSTGALLDQIIRWHGAGRCP